jgi:hypothetical protein
LKCLIQKLFVYISCTKLNALKREYYYVLLFWCKIVWEAEKCAILTFCRSTWRDVPNARGIRTHVAKGGERGPIREPTEKTYPVNYITRLNTLLKTPSNSPLCLTVRSNSRRCSQNSSSHVFPSIPMLWTFQARSYETTVKKKHT